MLKAINEDSSEDSDEEDEEELDQNEEWAIGVEEVEDFDDYQIVKKSIRDACIATRKLVSFFRRSTKAGELFRSETVQQNAYLSRDVKTRWSSTHKMIVTLLENMSNNETVLNIMSTEAERKHIASLYLSQEHNVLLKEILPVLNYFVMASSLLSGKEYPTTNLAYATLMLLKHGLEQQSDEEGTVQVLYNKYNSHHYLLIHSLLNAVEIF